MINKVIKLKQVLTSNGEKEGKKWVRIDLISEENGKDIKYSFFSRKKDGTLTKAAEFYKEHKKEWDDNQFEGKDTLLKIAYDEKEREFLGKDGQMHKGYNRNVCVISYPPKTGMPIGDQSLAENRLYPEKIIDVDEEIGDIPF